MSRIRPGPGASEASTSSPPVAICRTAGGGTTCGTILKYNAGHGARRMNPVSSAYCREVKKHLGGTLNDVVLASVAGAVGRFLRRRGERVDGLRFRAQVPMSIRGDAELGQGGNRIVMLLCELPVDEPDPRRRLARVIETTERLKSSRQRAGIELFEELSDRTLGSVFVRVAQFATRQRAFNLVVTNVPGPPMPVYLLGARMLEIHPLVPLAANQALGIALFSYDGGLNWGFNADWDALPDLHDFVSGLEQEFASLHAAAMAAAGPGAS